MGNEIGKYFSPWGFPISALAGMGMGIKVHPRVGMPGAFTGAVTGALAGRASDCGVLRGATLGAVAGAILSIEVLEASRAYWCSERPNSQNSSSMADFIEELLHGRLAQDHFVPTMFTDYRWQVSIANISYGDISDVYGEVASRGLSNEALMKLPCHVVNNEDLQGYDVSMCCTICLQDIEVGETTGSVNLKAANRVRRT
ncbi:hypothetical protein Scep_017266 [Stephania cephalantha]|uniref:Uncharacterized protein n=1 Tax=Stephania cephalantha TaxID=152367 RepID=A0AAP0IP62_9MAGN